jgi:hypothetical protein
MEARWEDGGDRNIVFSGQNQISRYSPKSSVAFEIQVDQRHSSLIKDSTLNI